MVLGFPQDLQHSLIFCNFMLDSTLQLIYDCIVPKMKTLAQRVKEFRMANLLTQKQAAKRFGISEFTLVRIEAGKPYSDLTRARIETKLNEEVAA
jgi:DNA-binding XRE family transcriptional regulator